MMDTETDKDTATNSECPICFKEFPAKDIDNHANRCIFLKSHSDSNTNRQKDFFNLFQKSPIEKQAKTVVQRNVKSRNDTGKGSLKFPRKSNEQTSKNANETTFIELTDDESEDEVPTTSSAKRRKGADDATISKNKPIPLAEQMRPNHIEDYMGQEHVFGKDTVIRTVLDKNEVPSMILWGPPGCGKTTLAHIIAAKCKDTVNCRFVKLSATMVGVNDVKEVIKVAKNEQSFHRKTILFMDEIHRFNKLQQDIFLPHVESGVITLIGATTENPSFSLNSALLSRCRVIVLEKLSTEDVIRILCRALRSFNAITIDDYNGDEALTGLDFMPKIIVQKESIKWLADMCDGDARIALNSLQLAMESICDANCNKLGLKSITFDSIKDAIKRSHILYDRTGDQHYDTISALHKSIRASDDNAALYWCTRMMEGGEDPRYICRRLIRAASEDIGLADPNAVQIAMAALQAVQFVGMPESDVIVAQCAIYLARAPKSSEAYVALKRCQRDIKECKGALPAVPLHLRNAPTKLMKDLGYGDGYNILHKDKSGLTYMPDGMEHKDYFY